jgi:hypothetical protein
MTPYSHADRIIALAERVNELEKLLARAERIVLKRYLITGGLHAELLTEMRQALGLPAELTDEDRAVADGIFLCRAAQPAEPRS